MGLLDLFRRRASSRDDNPAPPVTAPGWDGGWRRAAQDIGVLQRDACDVTGGRQFRDAVASYRDHGVMTDLGHLLDPGAPSGVVHGLLGSTVGVPVQRSGGAELPVRSTAQSDEPPSRSDESSSGVVNPVVPRVRPRRTSPPLTVARLPRPIAPRAVRAIRPQSSSEPAPAQSPSPESPSSTSSEVGAGTVVQRRIAGRSAAAAPLRNLPPSAVVVPTGDHDVTPPVVDRREDGRASAAPPGGRDTDHDRPTVVNRASRDHGEVARPETRSDAMPSQDRETGHARSPVVQRSVAPDSGGTPRATRPRLGIGAPISQLPESAAPASSDESATAGAAPPSVERPVVQREQASHPSTIAIPGTNPAAAQQDEPASDRPHQTVKPTSPPGDVVQRLVRPEAVNRVPTAGNSPSQHDVVPTPADGRLNPAPPQHPDPTPVLHRASEPSSSHQRIRPDAGLAPNSGAAPRATHATDTPGTTPLEFTAPTPNPTPPVAPLIQSSSAVQRMAITNTTEPGDNAPTTGEGTPTDPLPVITAAPHTTPQNPTEIHDPVKPHTAHRPNPAWVPESSPVTPTTVQRQTAPHSPTPIRVGPEPLSHPTPDTPVQRVRPLLPMSPLPVRTSDHPDSATTRTPQHPTSPPVAQMHWKQPTPPTTSTPHVQRSTTVRSPNTAAIRHLNTAVFRVPAEHGSNQAPAVPISASPAAPPTGTGDLVAAAPVAPATPAAGVAGSGGSGIRTSPGPAVQRAGARARSATASPSVSNSVPGVPAGVPVTVVQREAQPAEAKQESSQGEEKSAGQPDTDELARKLVEPVSRLLRAEFRQGRERIGRLHDRRR